MDNIRTYPDTEGRPESLLTAAALGRLIRGRTNFYDIFVFWQTLNLFKAFLLHYFSCLQQKIRCVSEPN